MRRETLTRHALPEAVVEGAVMTVRMPSAARQLARGLLAVTIGAAAFYSISLLGLCVLFATIGEAEPVAFVVLAVLAIAAPAPVAGAFLHLRRMRGELVIDRGAGVLRHRGGVAPIGDTAAVRVRTKSGRCHVELVSSTGAVLAVATDVVHARFRAEALRLASAIGEFMGRPVESAP